jgi:hypothetical protein
MKTTHDKSHQPLEFIPDDLVWLRLNQRAAVSVREGSLSKLAPKYYRSYHVLERIGGLTYHLQLLTWVRIHDVFHVTFLKKYTGVEPAAIPPLPPIVRGRVVPQPQQVVHARPTTQSWDLLVKWQNSSPTDASWDQLEAFKEAYPDFQLEDKLFEPAGVMLWTLIWASSIAEGGRHRVGPTVANVGHRQDYRP